MPYARNARTHTDAQVSQIAASIKEWGWTIPVLIDERDELIAGHARVLAAKRLGIADVPVVVARGWSDAKKRAYVIADNKLVLGGAWDEQVLAAELRDITVASFDLDLLGFAPDELASLLLPPDGESTVGDEDAIPEESARLVTRPGDIWLLGRHRLACGNATSISDVDRLMAGKVADLCFTSPPYGQQRDYASGGVGDWTSLMKGVFAALPMSQSGQVLVNLGLVHEAGEWVPYWTEWVDWMRDSGWRRFGWYVWDQGPGLPGDWSGRLAPSHEFIFHFNRIAERARKTKDSKLGGQTRRASGRGLRAKDGSIAAYTAAGKDVQFRKIPDSVIRIMRLKGRGVGLDVSHPAAFPVALAAEIHGAFSDQGDIIYEPFSGSGTSIIAANRRGRTCYAMELAPSYVDIAVRRWVSLTGAQAFREGDGRSVADVLCERDLAA